MQMILEEILIAHKNTLVIVEKDDIRLLAQYREVPSYMCTPPAIEYLVFWLQKNTDGSWRHAGTFTNNELEPIKQKVADYGCSLINSIEWAIFD